MPNYVVLFHSRPFGIEIKCQGSQYRVLKVTSLNLTIHEGDLLLSVNGIEPREESSFIEALQSTQVFPITLCFQRVSPFEKFKQGKPLDYNTLNEIWHRLSREERLAFASPGDRRIREMKRPRVLSPPLDMSMKYDSQMRFGNSASKNLVMGQLHRINGDLMESLVSEECGGVKYKEERNGGELLIYPFFSRCA